MGGLDKFIDYSIRAGQQAMKLMAFEEAAQLYERALATLDELDAEPADGARGQLYELYGKDEEALRLGELTKELDPLSPFYSGWLAEQYRDAEMFDKAIEEAEATLKLRRGYPVGFLVLGETYADLGDFDTMPLWRQTITANGLANATFMVAINRIGTEGPLTFYGSSFISDPYGRVVAQAPRDAPAVVVADLDLDQRRDWMTFGLFDTRRPDQYHRLVETPREDG